MTTNRRGEPLEPCRVSPGWRLDPLVGPTPLAGSNGLRLGPDGALYVAQANAGRIARVELDGTAVSVVPTAGRGFVGPDDLAFDSHGNLFVTEVMNACVSMRRPDGTTRVIAAETPAANGITVHADRIFMSEFNPQGRILELFADGSAPRTIAAGLVMPNALQLGPDGLLYFPQVVLGEVWRVSPAGGEPERISAGLAMPTAVKFDPAGRLWAVEAPTGAIIRIDIASGAHVKRLHVAPGVDNLVFREDGEMYVSHFTDGQIVQLSPTGAVRELVAAGLLGPFGIAATATGEVLVADGSSVARVDRAGAIHRLVNMVEPGAPGYARGVAALDDGALLISNTAGQVVRFAPGEGSTELASGLELPIGVTGDGADGAYLCDAGTGQVLQVTPGEAPRTILSGLRAPTGICRTSGGGLIVSEAGAGRVLHVDAAGHSTVLLDGLEAPHGVAHGPTGTFVLDYGARTLHIVPELGGAAEVLVRGLPLGAFDGEGLGALPGIAGILPGPIVPFGDIAALPDGRLAIGADGVGAILVLAPELEA